MKNMVKSITIVVLMISCTMAMMSTTAIAQHDHSSHSPGGHAEMIELPHGGAMKTVGKYNLEMVVDMLQAQNQIKFYLFKTNLKPLLNSEINGSVTIETKGGKSTTIDLRKLGEDGFTSDLGSTEPFKCTVRFTIKRKSISTYFSHMGLGSSAAAIYTCTMHPDIQSDALGTCPKCGMSLEKQ